MKIYFIGYYDEDDTGHDVRGIMKATTSYEAAREYVLSSIEKLRAAAAETDFSVCESEEKWCWDISYTLSASNRQIRHSYRIEEIDLATDEDVSAPRRPVLEKRCKALELQNDRLKSEIAGLNENLASCRANIEKILGFAESARGWLTFWDGGIYEDFDHMRANIHSARDELDKCRKVINK